MIQYKKLQKLADHLRRGKLGHAVFNFATVNDGEGQVEFDPKTLKINVKPCGTQGCAMGELPVVFPKDWEYPEPDFEIEDNRIRVDLPMAPTLVGGDHYHHLSDEVAGYFGISDDAVSHLFYPDSQDPAEYGGVVLDSTATKLQVAKNIEAFIAKMKKRRGK